MKFQEILDHPQSTQLQALPMGGSARDSRLSRKGFRRPEIPRIGLISAGFWKTI
jgi:hypothetical protein